MKVHPLLGLVILGSFYSHMAVRQYYTRHMPETPQPELRQTIPIEVNYGKTVYVSADQNRNLNIVYAVAPLNILAVVGYLLWRARRTGMQQP